MNKCMTDLDDCECFACLEVKRKATEFYRQARKNAEDTFGTTDPSPPYWGRHGKPRGKKIIKPVVTDIKPPEISEENWFFMTGTPWRNQFIHNDRCGANCKCDGKGNCTN